MDPRETQEEALHRLLAKGHDEGCQVLDDSRYDWWPWACRVTSSQPGQVPYTVNLAPGPLHGCDCEGYERWQRCKHYALALENAGLLPDLPDRDGDELDDHGLWTEACAAAPRTLAHMTRAERRAAARADLERRAAAEGAAA